MENLSLFSLWYFFLEPFSTIFEKLNFIIMKVILSFVFNLIYSSIFASHLFDIMTKIEINNEFCLQLFKIILSSFVSVLSIYLIEKMKRKRKR